MGSRSKGPLGGERFESCREEVRGPGLLHAACDGTRHAARQDVPGPTHRIAEPAQRPAAAANSGEITLSDSPTAGHWLSRIALRDRLATRGAPECSQSGCVSTRSGVTVAERRLPEASPGAASRLISPDCPPASDGSTMVVGRPWSEDGWCGRLLFSCSRCGPAWPPRPILRNRLIPLTHPAKCLRTARQTRQPSGLGRTGFRLKARCWGSSS